MSLEVEAKLAVDEHDPLRDRLRSLGARSLGRVLETNTLYDDADKSLLAAGSGLRVRRHDVLEGEARPDTLTYKGPCRQAAMKSREEIEVVIDRADAADELLRALGYEPVLLFQKRRETWSFRDCHVELDEVPYLGAYVEVEGPDESAIQGVLERLGLGDRDILTTSYIALLMDYCRRHDRPTNAVLFES